MAAPSKPYGLIFPKKAQQKTPMLKKHSVFADDSDEETSVGESLQKEALKKQMMKQTKLEIQKALAEDSTVYEYDSIYDDLQQQKKESNAKIVSGKDDKKPKYIENILKAAELRKKEQEKRMEKKIQKEREMEGGEFDDKEAFVTSAYKKLLQERAEEEEREKKEAALEACLDVTKQKDLSGFYRHLLNQAVGEEEVPKCSLREARIKEEKSHGYPDESMQRSKSPDVRTSPKAAAKEGDNQDAESDFAVDSGGDEEAAPKVRAHRGVSPEKKGGQESAEGSEEDCKHPTDRQHSRSPSEERDQPVKPPANPSKKGETRASRRDKEEHRREREDRPRHGDHGTKESCREGEDQEEKRRRKERKEREGHDREGRKEREREADKEQQRSSKDRHSDRDGGEKSGEKQAHAKEKREKEDKSEKKYRDGKENSPRCSERDRDKKETSTRSLEKNGQSDQERETADQRLLSSKKFPEAKPKAAEEGQKEEGVEQMEKPSSSMSKFAKRSNEETVTSARDRYLARQMARVSSKAYIEKEED
uniref:Nuclear speckle splicing regulatory protein 1 n=1 Tax=Sphenodon punctatus TaxID=8508 RepID=A0A8D0GGR0_SPHPU